MNSNTLKSLKYGIALAVIASLSTLVYFIGIKVEQTKKAQKLPAFSFYTLDSAAYTHTQLKDLPLLIIYFNSGCHFCQYEAKELGKQSAVLENIQVLMVSDESLKIIREFAAAYQLDKVSSIHFLKATNNSFYKTFGKASVPSIFIYNRQGELLKHFQGETTIEAILKYIP